MAFNPNELTRVSTANNRSSTVNYDLAYSEKVEKFRVSPEMFDQMKLEDHGLTLIEDSKEGKLYLAVEPNEMAVMHRGREGYNKGREFTASRMREKMNIYGMENVNKFTLKKVDTIDGIAYYEIVPGKPDEQEKENQPEAKHDPTPSGIPEPKDAPAEDPVTNQDEVDYGQNMQEDTPDQELPDAPAENEQEDNPFSKSPEEAVGTTTESTPEQDEEQGDDPAEEPQQNDDTDLDKLLD